MGDAGAIKADEKISPLVVDLDGTLLRSNLMLERALAFVRAQPTNLFRALLWAAHGNGALREHLEAATKIDVRVLPYEPAVLEAIAAARAEGRPVVLAANDGVAANDVAHHLKLFDQVITANAMRAPRERAKSHGFQIRAWARALRLHQWVKNALIFVPLLAAHKLTNFALLGRGLLAFLLFGLCASSVYLLNDLLDLEDDRHHKSKRNRPFASGQLSIKSGLIAFPLLLIAAFTAAILLLPWQFAAALGIYYILTLSYSLSLKRKMAVDVIALALLYTIRVIAGAAALQLPLTFWMLAFSTFMFLSLALAKRYGELRDAHARGETEKTRGRDYDPNDLEMISALGAAAGYQSVIVLALYVRDPHTIELYSRPEFIWLACPLLLFWVTRVWMLTHRGQIHDDPVVFAITDRVSLIVGALFCLVFLAAT
jgi:4-hydroxybenzoate polyprenyltransferase